MNFKKIIYAGIFTAAVLFTGCNFFMKNNDGNNPGSSGDTDIPDPDYSEDINPLISSTASVSQDFIFNTDSVGLTRITIRRSEWNKMLTYFDYFFKNENSVIAESYEYEKDGQKWKLNNVGLRLRGNTSRYRPQGKDTATDECGNKQMNADWAKDYYNYAENCSDDDYRQSHFKVDFEPMENDDRKLSNCMKGVALKRSDTYFSKEIFCYYLFHQYGIWTAPRASQTRVLIDFIEDLDNKGNIVDDISDCKKTEKNFGVYEMFEEVNKQSLKGRMAKKNNNKAGNAWVNNEGDLWKCSGGDLTASRNQPGNFGIEDIEIKNTDKPKSKWSYTWYNPCYDLKTNKSNLGSAAAKFQSFQTELNNLSAISAGTKAGETARKEFYEKWFDVDFFIRTYAVNCLVGMDDDYWGNANNYYLYFDNGTGGSGKCYLIPFDYDNTLGASINRDKVYTNPLEWGYNEDGNTHIVRKENRPLLDRLLEVPEYLEKFKAALLEVSSQDSDSPWNKDRNIALWNKWKNQVIDYVYSSDLKGWPDISSIGWDDNGGWKGTKHYLAQDSQNIYEQTTNNFRYWLSDEEIEIKFDLNGGTFEGAAGSITKQFNGINADFNVMIGTPEKEGCMFLGWTVTKNGSDYKTQYSAEEDLTVYASWKDISAFDGISIFEIPDDSYSGIKLGIVNLPENNFRRTFYINGREIGGDAADGDREKYKNYSNIWAYPFTETGKSYEIYVRYDTQDYTWLGESNRLTIEAKSGEGEFKVTNTPEYKIENNVFKFIEAPEIQIGTKKPRRDSNWDEYYLFEIQSTKKHDDSEKGYHDSWNYQSWNYMGAVPDKDVMGFDLASAVKEDVLDGTRYDLCFRLSYIYNSSPYGDLKLIIYDYGEVERFNLK